MQIDPMTFTEFFWPTKTKTWSIIWKRVDTIEPIPDAFFNPLYEKLKMYYVTGGMPEPVKMWTEARDVDAMQEALSGIINAYDGIFAKHPNINEFPKISMIWNLSRLNWQEKTKIIYKVVKEGARSVNMRTLCNGWWMPGCSEGLSKHSSLTSDSRLR